MTCYAWLTDIHLEFLGRGENWGRTKRTRRFPNKKRAKRGLFSSLKSLFEVQKVILRNSIRETGTDLFSEFSKG